MSHRIAIRGAVAGFTLVELLIVMVITVALTGSILVFAIDFWGSNASLQSNLDTLVTRSNAGDSLRDALNVSAGLISQNSLPDTHPMAPDPNDGTGQYWKLIHAIPGNTPIGASGVMTPVFYFESPAVNTSKNIILNGTNAYLNEFVLYLNGTTKQLLLRNIANSAATGNATKTTCPSSSATTSCPADKVIADNIVSVDTRYFSRSGNLIDYTSITDPLTGGYIGPDFPSVEVVELTLHLYQKSTVHGAQDTINSTVIRVAIRNN